MGEKLDAKEINILAFWNHPNWSSKTSPICRLNRRFDDVWDSNANIFILHKFFTLFSL
jgi:uncharacterized membrane protein YeiB